MASKVHYLPVAILAACLAGCNPFSPVTRLGPGEAAMGTVRLVGLAEQADSVVYVVDTTGAASSAGRYLAADVAKSLAALDSTQRFGLVLFGAESPNPFSVGGPDNQWALCQASRANVRAASQFLLSHAEHGPADDGACWRAVDAALHMKDGPPQVIYLVARRPWPAADLPERIRRANAALGGRTDWLGRPTGAPRVRIDAVVYVDPDAGEAMERIARENGGQFRMIHAVDLGRL